MSTLPFNSMRACSVYAVRLALTQTLEEEEQVKQEISENGFRCCVTSAGGVVPTWKEKAVRNVLGACLHSGVIEKKAHDVHAVLHALAEAEKGLLMDSPLVSSVTAKICIVTRGEWICCVAFGDCAIHALSHHDRLGFGMMHI